MLQFFSFPKTFERVNNDCLISIVDCLSPKITDCLRRRTEGLSLPAGVLPVKLRFVDGPDK
jgi:hypothetical protein